ncbi:hypothetical protein F4821DRAFT_253641 [Hypoxylon rubiginosum]|uniref:Uncharacterized protein n=1 Tax=Hypoxylon rubiginosum TaxID=110542 RepID=A0ACC0DJE3_9PEZI|nr:hypothetical protein F4821DRAFT_253641 [Hypoxylon rubiginosum]
MEILLISKFTHDLSTGSKIYSMSARLNPSALSAAVSGSSSRTPQTSYNLDAYLRGPPESVTERLVSNQKTPTLAEKEKNTKRELEKWQHNFESAAKPRDK